MAKHAIIQQAPGETDFKNHIYKKKREKIEDLNILKTEEDQKEYIEKNSKELAKLFTEIESNIIDLRDIDQTEDSLMRLLRHAEEDNKNSLEHLEAFKGFASNAIV